MQFDSVKIDGWYSINEKYFLFLRQYFFLRAEYSYNMYQLIVRFLK